MFYQARPHNHFNRFGARRSFNKRGFRGGNYRGFIESIHASKYVSKAGPMVSETPYIASHTFSDFAIDDRIKANISARGYVTPTPIQDQAISFIIEGKDVVGIANTGTGKTATFLIPIIHKILQNKSEQALIIVPTRELAMQVEEELRIFARGLNVTSVLCIGGSSILTQIQNIRRNPSVFIGTPGRLKDLIQRRIFRLDSIHTVVLDEVDRMVDIGFLHDIKYIVSLLPKNRQSLFFSATLSSDINGIIQSFLTDPITVSVKKEETAKNIEQDMIRVKDKQEKIIKLKSLLSQEEFTKVLIFGRTKWDVERLSQTLQSHGITADSIHGNKSQGQRFRVLSRFKRNELQALVATDIAARGLDIDDVSHVINFDEPATYTDYVHRIGRTGRANKAGKALTFVM